MFECFHCGRRTVLWDGDFDCEDYGYEGPGIVHCLHCENCGAMIQYIINMEDEEDGDENKETSDEN